MKTAVDIIQDLDTEVPKGASEREIEKALGLGERTLTARRLRRQPVPPHILVGRRVVYPLHLLRAWIDKQALGSGVLL